MITAHSGSDGTRPNSWEFINQYLKSKVDVIEIDVRCHKDGTLYLSHDLIGDFSDVVLLKDCFEKIKEYPFMKINCDLKESSLEKKVVELAEHYDILKQLILSGTVNPYYLKSMIHKPLVCYNVENYFVDFYSHHSKYEKDMKLWVDELEDYLKENQLNILNINYQFCSIELISMLHKKNIKVSLWTVDDQRKREEYRKIGVFNITTRQVNDTLKEEICSSI